MMETVTGTITRVIFSNDNGYKVILVRIPSGSHTVITGEFGPDIIPDTVAAFHGDFKNHAKYGTQFKTASYEITYNAEELASIRLFIDNIAPNIGPERAKAIVHHFKQNTIDVLDTNPERLIEVEGIGEVSSESLIRAWQENRQKWNEERQIYSLRSFLNALGVKERRVKGILSAFGGGMQAEEKIRESPYVLMGIEGFGFTTADFIAKKLLVPENSPDRFKAFVTFLLETVGEYHGHLFLYMTEIPSHISKYCTDNATSFLGKDIVTLNDVTPVLKELEEEKAVVIEDDCVYFKKSYKYELESAKLLVNVMSEKSDLMFLNKESVDQHIERFELENNLTLSNEQRDALHFFAEYKVFVITGAPGTGKCLGYDTPVLMFDGNIKKVQDIKEGDFLMGDDSTSRKVLSTCQGREPLYEVTPIKGDAYCVNESHILSLKETGGRSYDKGKVVDIGINEYLKLATHRKSHLKGYRVPIEFPEVLVPVDPYLIGFWLGNGDTTGTRISTPFHEVVYYIGWIVQALGLSVKKVAGDNVDYGISCDRECEIYASLPDKRDPNPFLTALRDLGLIGHKHIPDIYKVNSRSMRLRLLAGIIDSDGHLLEKDNTFEITLILKDLSEDVIFLARSLGFSAYLKPCRKKWSSKDGKYKGEGTYYRFNIAGEGLEDIPTVVPKKRARPRKQKKSVLVTGITVQPVGVGDYYGFELGGNGRFLLGDFTVTHNTTVLKAVVEMARKMHLTLTCMTPTGISAKKLAQTIGEDAYTIHRRLGFRGDKWVYNDGNQYDTDVAILDEMSMVDQEVFYHLLSALRKRTHIVFVGDQHQLPSVGAGNVLKELIKSGEIPVVCLEKIFRQDEASDIIKVAHRIKNGDVSLDLFKSDPKADVFFMRQNDPAEIEKVIIALAKKFKDERRLFQIITPRREGPLSVASLNETLQRILNPPSPFLPEVKIRNFIIRKGDRVIVRKNDYENDIFNGDIGKVADVSGNLILITIDERTVALTVEDAGAKLNLAYSITVHRAQGLEYPYVILPFINQFGKMLLQRNLIYTAITRAKEKVIILGHGSAIERAINNSSVSNRNTKLGERIRECLQIKRKNSMPPPLGEPQDFQDANESTVRSLSETDPELCITDSTEP